MNSELQSIARQIIKDGLSQLTEHELNNFKLMYGRNNGKRSVEDTLKLDINYVVDNMEPERLDWAMTQVKNS
jgi:hypothetical protein